MVAKAGRRDWQDMQTRAEEAGLFRQRAEQFGVDQGVIHDAPGLVNDPNVAAVVATVLMFSTTKCKVEELRNFWPASHSRPQGQGSFALSIWGTRSHFQFLELHQQQPTSKRHRGTRSHFQFLELH
jgi:hypothetical protein